MHLSQLTWASPVLDLPAVLGAPRLNVLSSPGHGGRVVSPELVALAEDPEFFLEPPDGSRRIIEDAYCLTIGPGGRWAGVCRLRLPASSSAVAACVSQIREHVAGIETVVWGVGSSATPQDLPDRVRTLGLHDPDPPLDPVCAAMALAGEPPAVEGVEVRRIETLQEHLAGLEIMLASASWDAGAAAAERTRAEEVYEGRTRRGGYQWLAWSQGGPVACAIAERAAAGL
jgi:hypothetical protein